VRRLLMYIVLLVLAFAPTAIAARATALVGPLSPYLATSRPTIP